jgi:hypothetical protein
MKEGLLGDPGDDVASGGKRACDIHGGTSRRVSDLPVTGAGDDPVESCRASTCGADLDVVSPGPDRDGGSDLIAPLCQVLLSMKRSRVSSSRCPRWGLGSNMEQRSSLYRLLIGRTGLGRGSLR